MIFSVLILIIVLSLLFQFIITVLWLFVFFFVIVFATYGVAISIFFFVTEMNLVVLKILIRRIWFLIELLLVFHLVRRHITATNSLADLIFFLIFLDDAILISVDFKHLVRILRINHNHLFFLSLSYFLADDE